MELRVVSRVNVVCIILCTAKKDNTVELKRFNDRIMTNKLDVSTEVADIISAYKPYRGLSEMKMKNF